MSEEKIFKINLSVKFKKNGSARRFIIRADDFQGLFSAFSAEMANAAPNSSIFWIDGDGDNVIITSVAEFEEAYIQSGFPNNNLLVVTTEDKPVESAAPQQPQLLQQQHVYTGASHNALCDLCDVRITGTRFRCLICNDFDLCCNCESIGAHAEHAMLRIVDPITTYVPWGAKINQTVNGIIDAATKNTANVHQFDDFRTKSVQIMNDVGSLISTTLSNFGIEADYDVYDRGCRRTNPTSTNAASASSSGEKKEENKKEENKMKTPKNNAGKTEAMKGIIAGLQKLSKVPEGFNELPTTTVPATAETENVNIMKKYENTFKKVDAAGARITALKKFDESLESLAALGREKELRDQAKNQGFNAAKKQGAVAVPGLFSAKQRKGETDNSTKFSTGGFHAVKETMPVGKGLFSRHKVDGQKNRAHQNTTRRLGYHSDDSIERSPSPPRLGSGFQKSKNAFGQKPCTFGTSSKATAPPAHMGFGTAKNTGCYRSDNAKACSFHSQKTSGFGGFERKPIFGGFGAGARSTPFSSRGFESNSGFGGSTGFGGNAFESAPVYGGFPPRGGFGERSGFGGDSGFGGCKRSGYGGGSVFGGASGFGGFKREGFGDAPFGQPSGMKYDPYEDLLDEDHPDHVYEPSDFNDESVLAPKRLSKEKKQAKKAEKAAAKAEKAAAKQAAMEASVKATEAVEIVEKQENTVAAKTSLALASCEVALDQKKDSVAEIKKPNILEKVAVNLEAPIENTVTTVVPFVQKEEVCDAALPVQTKTDEDAQSIGSEVEHLDDVDSDGWVDAKSTMPSAPEIENPIEAANETIETVLSPVPSTSQQAVYPQLSRDDVMAGSQARQETYGELLLMGYVEVDSRRAIAHCGADLGKCVDYIAGYLN